MSKPNFKSKWVANCVALLVLASSTIADAKPSKFMDIHNSYAEEAILLLAEQGIMSGISSTSFAPHQEISRQDFAVILSKALGIQPLFPKEPTFIDLDPLDLSYGYVEALAALGLVTGDQQARFAAQKALTRQDAAVILFRGLANQFNRSAQEMAYADRAEIATYALEAVDFVTKEGYMRGNGQHLFMPKQALTRAETAVIAERLLQRGNLIGDYFWGVEPAVLELKVGESKQIRILSQQGVLLAYTPIFGIDNPELGTVSTEGIFTAVKAGQGLLTVNVGQRQRSLMVIVHD